MNAIQKADAGQYISETILGEQELDRLSPHAENGLTIRPAEAADLEDAWRLANRSIPGALANPDAVRRVVESNRDSVQLFLHEGELVGLWAMLLLTPLGLERLLLGELDLRTPLANDLCAEGETPAALYLWAVVAPGHGGDVARLIGEFVRQPKYLDKNLFTRPITPDGLYYLRDLGFRQIDCPTADLHRYVRLANRPTAAADASRAELMTADAA